MRKTSADQAIRGATAGVVLAVGGFAAAVSYSHIYVWLTLGPDPTRPSRPPTRTQTGPVAEATRPVRPTPGRLAVR
jgi:hypothetical protein